MAMAVAAAVQAVPNGTLGAGNTDWIHPRINRRNLAPRWTVNRIAGTPADGDLRYAACKLHAADDLHWQIKEKYLDGWFWAEQKYTGGSWATPTAWIVAEGLRDSRGPSTEPTGTYDTAYSLHSFNYKDVDEKKCKKTNATAAKAVLDSGRAATNDVIALTSADASLSNVFVQSGSAPGDAVNNMTD